MCTSLRVCVMPKKAFCTCKNHIPVSSCTLNKDHDQWHGNNTCALIEAIPQSFSTFKQLALCGGWGSLTLAKICTIFRRFRSLLLPSSLRGSWHVYGHAQSYPPVHMPYSSQCNGRILVEFVGVSAPNGYKVTLSCHAMYAHTNMPHKHYTDHTDSVN